MNHQIVFMSLMNGSQLQVYVMNADGAGLQQLTNAANNGDPVWSTDGNRIVFGSDREGGNKVNLFAMKRDGSGQEQLTLFDFPHEAGDANWSSDGTKIAFEYDIDGMKQSDPDAFAEVWTMNADGSGAASTGVRCSGADAHRGGNPRAVAASIAAGYSNYLDDLTAMSKLSFSSRVSELASGLATRNMAPCKRVFSNVNLT